MLLRDGEGSDGKVVGGPQTTLGPQAQQSSETSQSEKFAVGKLAAKERRAARSEGEHDVALPITVAQASRDINTHTGSQQ